MNLKFPKLKKAGELKSGNKILFISAYGFEERSLAWTAFQIDQKKLVDKALIVKYENPKGKNKVRELKSNLKKLGVSRVHEIPYYGNGTDDVESLIANEIESSIDSYNEIVLDITPLTKFLILIFLCKLEKFEGVLRIVYTEALNYAPSHSEYSKAQEKFKKVVGFPSKGFGAILRAKCLGSIRMQGQPVTLVAFTSFNEQLVRHMLGTLNPHRLLFINGVPPRKEFKWREKATGLLHTKLIKEYPKGNEITDDGFLKRAASTLFYDETVFCVEKIYEELGLHERIIIAATGSKMQTVGLFFAKKIYPDIHIEYPTPDSYYIKGFSTGIRDIYEIEVENFSSFVFRLANLK